MRPPRDKRPHAVSVIFEARTLNAIDAWASEHDVVGSRAEAVRRLVDLALITAKKKRHE